jgi:hypothetical protein
MRINNVDFTRLKDIDIVNILNNSSTSQDQRIILKRITLLFENNDEFINFFIVNSHLINWSILSRSKSSKIIRQVHNIINLSIPPIISRIVCIASFILNASCIGPPLRKICPLCTTSKMNTLNP